MDVLFEQRIVQNALLGAETIWSAINEAYEANSRIDGVLFPLVFLVLPLTFHRRTAESLASKQRPGAIYKALADNREITVGLQQRIEALSKRTFQSLSVGFATGLFDYDQGGVCQIVPRRKTPPVKHITDEVKTIHAAAKRVGQTFSELSIVQISNHLGIKF